LVVIAVWWVINDRAHEHIESATDNTADINQSLIQHDIDHRISALDRLAQRWTATDGTPRAVWEGDAMRYVADMQGFQAIAWADATLHIRWVVPFDRNETMLDMDVAASESNRIAVAAARRSSRAALTQPFELANGELALAVYIPVSRNSQFDGAIVGVLHLETWLAAVIEDVQSTDYHTRVLVQGREAYRYDADNSSADESGADRKEFEMLGLTWTILITPTSSFLSAGHAESSSLVLIAGLLFSAVVAVAVYLIVVARVRSRQLHETAGQLATLFENLPGMAYRCTGQPRRPMEFVSEGCRKLSGYPRSDFEEQRVFWGDLIHVDDRDAVSRKVREAIENATAYEIEYRILTRDNQEKWMWERGRTVRIEGHENNRLEGFVSDISRQRAAETVARQQREQLAHMDRLDMLGEMATGIAHEINQPLTAISLFSEAGKRLFSAGKQNQLPGIFEKLSQHAHRAGAVIERMQTMARRQESAKEIVDCTAVVEGVAKLADAAARFRDMTIEVELEGKLPAIEIDTVQIQQVALNLLRNGMEAMRSVDCRDGNTIRLQTRLRADGDVEVAVVDKGCGVSEAAAKILFTPFSTTKKTGMGMGLSISRAIITAHGGHLDFFNNESGGATFFFTLPPAQEEN
jgi:signal transduction histidine kinase/sensor domain CHASE-containing protein